MADLFQLVGRMRVEGGDTVRRELQGVSDEGEKTESKLGGVLGKIGGVVKTAGKLALAGVGAAAGGIVAITKQSVDAYARYEQLVGGVETLFKDSAGQVIDYANNAFKTAGMSANDYMELATASSASMLQSLGGDTKKAAEMTNMAITDMSDNANKMGTDIERITDAYGGFAKQNYTMLDNLKLGYGGTKTEMERLIADANKLKVAQGEVGDLTIEKYSDIVEAIHLVQTDMGITGTTAKEAAETIEGSLAMTKASWENLLTGMGDDTQDFNLLLDNFITSAGTAAKNLLPRIKMIFEAIPKAIKELAPMLPTVIQELLPPLLTAAITLVGSLIAELPNILKALGEALVAALKALWSSLQESAPELAAAFQGVFDFVMPIIEAFANNIDIVVIAIGALATAVAGVSFLSWVGQGGSVIEMLGKMKAATLGNIVAKGQDMIATAQLHLMYAKDAILKGAMAAKTIALSAAQKGAAAAQWLLNAAMNANPLGIIIAIIAALVVAFITLWNTNEDFRNAVMEIWNSIWSVCQTVFGAIGDFISMVWNTIGEVASTVWNGIQMVIDTVLNAISMIISTIFEGIRIYITTVLNIYKTIFTTVWNAIKTVVSTVINVIKTVITTVFNAIQTVISTVWNAIKNTITTVINAIKSVIDTVFNAIKSVITTVVNAIKNTISTVWNAIKSVTSTVFNAIKSTISTVFNGIKSVVDTVVNAVKSVISTVWNAIKSTTETVWNGIKTAIETPLNAARDFVKGIIDTIKGFFNFNISWPHIPLPHFGIKPAGWQIGDLLKGSIPSLAIDWYAKGGIFDKPTITPTVDGLKGFGEAGAEAVTPIDVLLDYVRKAVAEQNAGVYDALNAIYELLGQWLPQIANADMQVVMDGGALVGAIAPAMDRALGDRLNARNRGSL